MITFNDFLQYSKKVFHFNDFLSLFNAKRKYKHFYDSDILLSLISGLVTGLHSLNGFAESGEAEYSRPCLIGFLEQAGLANIFRSYIVSLVKKMKKNKCIILSGMQNKIIATVDGVEVYRNNYSLAEFIDIVDRDLLDKHSQIAFHYDKVTGKKQSVDVYVRMVIVTIITDRGVIPIAWQYQFSENASQFKAWAASGKIPENMPTTSKESSEKLKQSGELSTLKILMRRIKNDFKHIPFDVLVGDGLYDKSSILELCNQYNIALVSVLKDPRRELRQGAEDDFSTSLPTSIWNQDKLEFTAWQKVDEDKNVADKKHNKVRIFKIIRKSEDVTIENYFYCSNMSFIKPRFVEKCRYHRWEEENAFNSWTNIWKVLKHKFHHSHCVSDAIIGLFFIVVILVTNYVLGNLKRGLHSFTGTFAEIFLEMTKSLPFRKRSGLIKCRKKLIKP